MEEDAFWIVEVDGEVDEVDEDAVRCAIARRHLAMAGRRRQRKELRG